MTRLRAQDRPRRGGRRRARLGVRGRRAASPHRRLPGLSPVGPPLFHVKQALAVTSRSRPPQPAAATVFGTGSTWPRGTSRCWPTPGSRHGLIGPREAPRLWDRHVLNSAVVDRPASTPAQVADIGSGAGLPGIPLAIARPDLTSPWWSRWRAGRPGSSRRSTTLGLDNVTVHRGRAESLWGGAGSPRHGPSGRPDGRAGPGMPAAADAARLAARAQGRPRRAGAGRGPRPLRPSAPAGDVDQPVRCRPGRPGDGRARRSPVDLSRARASSASTRSPLGAGRRARAPARVRAAVRTAYDHRRLAVGAEPTVVGPRAW